YIVYDPERHLGKQPLYIFERRGLHYVEIEERWLAGVGLGVTLWHGEYAGFTAEWLRWCDIDGELYLTGVELAQQYRALATEAQQRADEERQRADEERQRADEERQRVARLTAQLRALGIEPNL
ncbi:MAG: hypothetical protein KF893_12980, partial [Caldilineaceae bacterium]|nr:hypothetical protein [Caldilineaceae bacterium]